MSSLMACSAILDRLKTGWFFSTFVPVLRIHDIWCGSGCWSESFYFHHWPSRCQQKTNLNKSFSAHYFFMVLLHHFSKVKSKKTHQNRNQGFSYFFCLMIEGSWGGAGSIPLTNGSDPGGPKTRGSGGSGSATLVCTRTISFIGTGCREEVSYSSGVVG